MRKDPARPSWADVTPKHLFLNRRALIGGALALGVAAPAAAKIAARPSPYSTDAAPNSYEQITGYNNYYEFGWDKGDPAQNAGRLEDRPVVGRDQRAGGPPGQLAAGRCAAHGPGRGADLPVPLRGGLVDGHSLDRVSARGAAGAGGGAAGAKYVAFQTLYRPEEMPGQRAPGIDWPYVEGLRLLDEGDASADASDLRTIWRGAAQSERRAAQDRGAMEIRLQVDQEHREDQPGRGGAAHHLERAAAARIRLLCQCESGGGSSALVAGDGAGDRGGLP